MQCGCNNEKLSPVSKRETKPVHEMQDIKFMQNWSQSKSKGVRGKNLLVWVCIDTSIQL